MVYYYRRSVAVGTSEGVLHYDLRYGILTKLITLLTMLFISLSDIALLVLASLSLSGLLICRFPQLDFKFINTCIIVLLYFVMQKFKVDKKLTNWIGKKILSINKINIVISDMLEDELKFEFYSNCVSSFFYSIVIYTILYNPVEQTDFVIVSIVITLCCMLALLMMLLDKIRKLIVAFLEITKSSRVYTLGDVCSAFFVIYLLSGLAFAILYNLEFYGLFPMLKNVSSWHDYIYFSFITLATIGYGDITPIGIGKLIVVVESGVGIFLTAITVGFVISYFSRKPQD